MYLACLRVCSAPSLVLDLLCRGGTAVAATVVALCRTCVLCVRAHVCVVYVCVVYVRVCVPTWR